MLSVDLTNICMLFIFAVHKYEYVTYLFHLAADDKTHSIKQTLLMNTALHLL